MRKARRSMGGYATLLAWVLPLLPASGDETGPRLIDRFYEGYAPTFDNSRPPELMKSSLQPTFYNRAVMIEDPRVDGLVREGVKREADGDYAEAMKLYQKVIDRFPEVLIQVNAAGVYVSAARYVQERLLLFPPKDLDYYRTVHDPAAREMYDRFRAHNSTEGLRDIVEFCLATSYGERALFDLGSQALDAGQFEEAAGCFERIREWFRRPGVDPGEVLFRLAWAYKRLGREDRWAELRKDPTAAHLSRERLAALDALRPDPAYASVRSDQCRNPKYLCYSDYAHFSPPEGNLSSDAFQWRITLPGAPNATVDDRPSGGELLPFHRPWIVENSVFYKHYNRIYCRSLVTGNLRWAFELGAVDRDAGRYAVLNPHRGPVVTAWYADQDILVDGGLVFANVRVRGPRESLVALDAVTGEIRWSAGPVSPASEDDLMTRYDAAPGLGRHSVFAAWSRVEGEDEDLIGASVGLTSFDKASGRVLWRREICRLTPTATAQTRQGIRVLSTAPVVSEGILYHVTNAGVIAALDAATGTPLWVVRYPHGWNTTPRGPEAAFDAHDAVSLAAGAPGTGPHFNNQPPLLRGGRLYVTPTDSDHFLCLDAKTGKVLWNIHVPQCQYLLGFTREGHLVLAGSYCGVSDFGEGRIELRDADNGSVLWQFVPAYRSTWRGPGGHEPGGLKTMRLLCRPTLTTDDTLLFSTFAAPPYGSGYHGGQFPVRAEWSLSLRDRKLLDQRVYFAPTYRDHMEAYMRGVIREQKDFRDWLDLVPPQDVNAPFPYDAVRRLPFRFHGVPFELVTSGDRMWARFDLDGLKGAVAGGKAPRDVFTRAEIALARGDGREAAVLLEDCRKGIRPEERDFLREVDRELFRLYSQQAWEALLAGDAEQFHDLARRMSRTACTAEEEIRSLLVLAESFQRKGDAQRALRCLQNVIRHDPGTLYALSSTFLSPPADSSKILREQALPAARDKPADLQRELSAAEKACAAAMPALFSAAAPVAPDMEMEADSLATLLVRRLLALNPACRASLEEAAVTELATASARESAFKAYPETRAAQKILNDLCAEAAPMAPNRKQTRLWELNDLASRLALKTPPEAEATRLSPARSDETLFPAALAAKSFSFDDAEQNLRLLLPCRSGGSSRVFIGGRSRKRLDSKFSLECWDADAGKKLWAAREIRLKAKGSEKGFEEVFLSDGRVITHGRFDVLAFAADTGALQWRFEVPFAFDLQSVIQVGGLLVLSGASHTIGLQASTGDVVWSATETGSPYCPPFVRDGVLVAVRREPFGVAFRRLGSGELLRFLRMPNLDLETTHPILAEDISRGAVQAGTAAAGLPVAFDGDLLILSDGIYFIAVDTEAMSILWKRSIDDNDPLVSAPPLRFTLKKDRLLVLKRDFNVPALHMLNARTGELRWSKKDRETVYSVVFDDSGDTFYGIAAPESARISVTVRGFEAATGKETCRWEWVDLLGPPDACIAGRFAKGGVVLRVIHGERMDLLAVDVPKGKEVFRVGLKAPGPFGEHGGKSAVVQEPRFMLMNSDEVAAAVPADGR